MSLRATTPRESPPRRRLLIAACAVFALALGLRFAFWSQVRGGALDEWHRYDQSDMATYLAQADQFASGDWLASEPVHPYHGWQTVAPPEKWLAWYGPHVFHQAPGYAYLLAFARSLSDEPLELAKAVQLVLGACTAVFALLLGAELFGLAAGVIAGVWVAGYGPLYYLEAQLLREGPALCALFALAWLLARELRIERGGLGRALACGLLGVAIGLFHVLHEMGTVVLVVAALVLGLHHARAGLRAGRAAAVQALAALAVGYVVGFAPLLARNLAVGAPPFSVSCRTLINFAEANEANAAEGGATFIAPGPAVVKILDEADGSFLRMLGGVWATYDGDVAKLVGNWWLRWSAVWKRFEEPDNTSFYFYREYSALLASSPTFAWLFPLGVAGLLVAAWAAWRALRSGEHAALANPRGVLAACALLLAVAGALSFVHTVARFRLYVTPALFVGAGFALASTWSALRAQRTGSVGALVGLAVLAALYQGSITRETERDRFRPVDWYVAASVSQTLGQHERALAFADDSAKRYTGDVNLYLVLGPTFESAKRWSEARACYERALAALPQSPDARRGLARVQAALGGAK